VAPNKRKILEAARKFAQKGSRDRALKEYEKLLKLDPRDAKLRLEIGDAQRRWGDVEAAISAYNKVAEQYMDEGFDARAVAVFKQIQNLAPERYSSYVPLAELYQRMGLTAEAIQSLQVAADGYHRKGEKREALALLRKMAKLDPSNTTSRIKVADLLRQEGMKQEAIAEYEEAYAELERQGEPEPAGTVLERILEVDPNRVATLGALSQNLVSRGFAERAEPFARRALEAEPEEVEHYERLADVYRAQQRDEELKQTYRSLADLYRKRGDEDSARAIMQRFVPPDALTAPLEPDPEPEPTTQPPDTVLLNEDLLEDDLLTEDLPLQHELVPAADDGRTVLDFEEVALEEDPLIAAPSTQAPEPPLIEGDPDQLLAEASVYLRYGKRTQAIANLEAILAREPKHRGALEKLGEAHADGGQSASAVQTWLRAAEGAREAGDQDGLAVLRDRIAALDPEAAAALGVGVPEPEVEELIELPGEEAEAPQTGPDASEMPEIEFEDEIEIEVDAGEEPDAVTRTAPAALGASQSASASMSQQIGEDMEEAEFYRGQGLFDEAEAIYQRILQLAPNHSLALVRLGEIAAERGDDPGSLAVAPAPEPEAAAPADARLGEDLAEWTDGGLSESDAGLGDAQAASEEEDDDTGVNLETTDSGSLDLEIGDDDLADDEVAIEIDDDTETGPLDEEPEPRAARASGPPARPGVSRAEETDPNVDSFDLAAELSGALDDDDSSSAGSLGSMTEQDVFAAVFSEFKKGVSKTLNEGDHEAHYDLGIAYREMGLLDDAIGEFQAAAGCAARRVDGLHMMGLCLLDLGRAEDAVAGLQQALSGEEVSEAQTLAVRFELGRAFEMAGDPEQAREAWQAVAALDPKFCDVTERLAALDDPKPEVAAQADESDGEELERFDDLFDDDEADEAPEGYAAQTDEEAHESFSDLIEEANADLDEPEPPAAAAEPADLEDELEAEPAPFSKPRRKKKISFV